MKLDFLPPQYWQEFEEFVRGVVEIIWEQKGYQNYGRQGQYQSGIDIFGYDDKGNFVGIQCKKKSQVDSEGIILKNSLLTKSLIQKEINEAEKIKSPKVDRFIFATTSFRDTKVQDIIRQENHDNNNFSIEIWFWEDFQVHIERHRELMYWYYEDYLRKIKQYNLDIHILTLHKQAFSRPAFQRKIIREESGADFFQAIKDTQEAIKTGRLYNRRGDLITSSFPTDKLTKKDWREKFDEIYQKLDEIRDLYSSGLKNKKIMEYSSALEVLDINISKEFNEKRRICLKTINEVLKEAKIELVKSSLI